MDIDLNTPSAERIALPTLTAPVRNRHRQHFVLAIIRENRPIRSIDCASIAVGLVPEARQTYPPEDDCTAVTRGKRF